MPDTIPGADSTVDPATLPVGTGEPTNDQPGETAAAAPEAPGLDEAFLGQLESMDWTKIDQQKLPQAFKDHFVPKPEFTKKTQDLADERRALEQREKAVFELARKAISDRAQPAGPTAADQKKAELFELAAGGDKEALQQVIKMEAESLVGPIQAQASIRDAAERARAADPVVVQHWNEIVQTLQNDPVLNELATVQNHKYADKVMLALGLEHKAKDLAVALGQKDTEITGLKAKISQYERERVGGLPPSTTKAGTTNGRPAAGEVEEFMEAARRAYLESGGRAEDFR